MLRRGAPAPGRRAGGVHPIGLQHFRIRQFSAHVVFSDAWSERPGCWGRAGTLRCTATVFAQSGASAPQPVSEYVLYAGKGPCARSRGSPSPRGVQPWAPAHCLRFCSSVCSRTLRIDGAVQCGRFFHLNTMSSGFHPYRSGNHTHSFLWPNYSPSCGCAAFHFPISWRTRGWFLLFT